MHIHIEYRLCIMLSWLRDIRDKKELFSDVRPSNFSFFGGKSANTRALQSGGCVGHSTHVQKGVFFQNTGHTKGTDRTCPRSPVCSFVAVREDCVPLHHRAINSKQDKSCCGTFPDSLEMSPGTSRSPHKGRSQQHKSPRGALALSCTAVAEASGKSR